MPGLPPIVVPFVDVRDAAEAHVKALLIPGLHGKRIIVSKEETTMVTLARVLRNEFS